MAASLEGIVTDEDLHTSVPSIVLESSQVVKIMVCIHGLGKASANQRNCMEPDWFYNLCSLITH